MSGSDYSFVVEAVKRDWRGVTSVLEWCRRLTTLSTTIAAYSRLTLADGFLVTSVLGGCARLYLLKIGLGICLLIVLGGDLEALYTQGICVTAHAPFDHVSCRNVLA